MDPACYPTESVALQGRNDGYPGPPAGPAGVQYTLLEVAPEAPNDHVIWSIFNFFHCNPCCLGLAALVYSFKARDRKMAGDVNGARHYGSTARCLNIWATVLIPAIFLISIIVCVLVYQTNGYGYRFNHRN